MHGGAVEKKMAAGDLSWWPHARAARRAPPRAQNFATSGFYFLCPEKNPRCRLGTVALAF